MEENEHQISGLPGQPAYGAGDGEAQAAQPAQTPQPTQEPRPVTAQHVQVTQSTAAQPAQESRPVAAQPTAVQPTQVAQPTAAQPAQEPRPVAVQPLAAHAAYQSTAERTAYRARTVQQPPVPGQANYQHRQDWQAGYGYTAQQVQPQVQPVQTERSSGGCLKTALAALLGGLLGALMLFGALKLTGALDPRTITVEQDSSAGQTIEITPTTVDADMAKVVAKKALPSVVSIYVTTSTGSGVGSGVIIDEDGNILTNHHVINGARTITVTIGHDSYTAEVVGSDASSDLAVIKADLEGASVTPIEVGDSDELVVGDWVMAIGSPYGLEQSVSTGIVSSLYRSTMMTSASGNTIYANLIQTDATINPGNSGGALVNSEGKLVGINSIIQSNTGSSVGIGFAIPGNYAVEVAKTIIAGDVVLHPYVGVSLNTVNAQNAAYYDLPVNSGAYLADVTSGGPADEAGLKQGDIITFVEDEPINSADALILAIRSHKIGETVTVTFMRGSQEMTAEVTLGSDEPLQAATGLSSGSGGGSGNGYGYGYGYGENNNGG